MLRLDLVFSVWIFVWFVIFIIGLITYNPTFIILLAIIIVIISIYLGIYYFGIDRYNITKFVVINIFMKSIPISLLWYYKQLRIKYRDVIFTLILFIVYNMYLLLNGTNIIKVYSDMVKAYQNKNEKDDKRTIISKAYDYMYQKIISTS